jgi:hypothetical protein
MDPRLRMEPGRKDAGSWADSDKSSGHTLAFTVRTAPAAGRLK